MHTVEFEQYFKCYEKAQILMDRGYPVGNMTVEQLTELLIKIENEKADKEKLTDQRLDYNDEIVAIEEVGDLETVDISVTGDNLFYCNNILTKNSFGLPATADFMFAIITNEELESLNQLMIKQLKNRYGDLSRNRRFVVGIDRAKMKLYNIDPEDQGDIQDDIPVMDKTNFGERDSDFFKKRSKFDKGKFEGFA